MRQSKNTNERRRFLKSGLAAGLGLPLFGCQTLAGSKATKGPLFTQFGINGSLDEAALLAAQGADFLLIGVNQFLMPDKPVTEFEKELRRMEQWRPDRQGLQHHP